MEDYFDRTSLLLGEEAMAKLRESHIAIFGIGGVGGYALEALARSGIEEFTLIDNDTVAPSNINRQIIATQNTIGHKKVDVAETRLHAINSNIVVHKIPLFYLPGLSLPFSSFSYIIDAIDTISAKLSLIEEAKENSIPIVSAMGAGNKLDPTQLKVSDIFSTHTDPLSRVIRRELKKRGIKNLDVVWSPEEPKKTKEKRFSESGKPIPGSVSFVPSVMGLIIASLVIRKIIEAKP